MSQHPTGAQDPPRGSSRGAGLTIGELARRTGVTTATLRAWESRHGFPQARRLASGHRRYDERQVELVRQVQRRRETGIRLESAIAELGSGPRAGAPSVFARLRSGHPALTAHVLRKSTLVALSRALEDECCARAERPWLFGAFQEERFYRRSEARWRELARTSRGTWVFAALPPAARSRRSEPPGPVRVGLDPASPLRREWVLVCDSEDRPACLAAWEHPGQRDVPDRDRLFEAVWSLDPVVVRDATTVLGRLLDDAGHDTAPLAPLLQRQPLPATRDLRQASSLFSRVVAYVDHMDREAGR